MGQVRTPARVNFFCGLLLAPTVPRAEVEANLEQLFGPITLHSPILPFTQTAYYEREMGSSLVRTFVAFGPLRQMDDLADLKHATNRLETHWSDAGRQRRVNLDPGYLDLAKVVLATTKDYSHRLYIGSGIYAEVTLRYQHKRFQRWAWTYPDYREPVALDFFTQLREIYKTQLRAASDDTGN